MLAIFQVLGGPDFLDANHDSAISPEHRIEVEYQNSNFAFLKQQCAINGGNNDATQLVEVCALVSHTE